VANAREITPEMVSKEEGGFVRRFPPGTRLYALDFPLADFGAVALWKPGVHHFAEMARREAWAKKGWPEVRTFDDFVEHHVVHNRGAILSFGGPYDPSKMVGRPVILGPSFAGPWHLLDGSNRVRGALLSCVEEGRWARRPLRLGEMMPVVAGVHPRAEEWAEW
jgi:hypothetical protein